MALFSTTRLSIPKETLVERYIIPPFSVINSHQPYVKARFKFWESLGLCADDGRDTQMAYDNRRMNKKETGKKSQFNGTSVFNPVVCEVMYKWFTVPNSKVLDPFAGGIVRGAMASILGHSYVGYDISTRQVETNRRLYSELHEKLTFPDNTIWVNENSQHIDMCEVQEYDFVLTCPPYYNLEKYTDDEHDLSNQQTYGEFLDMYTDILRKTASKLKEDSFFVIVVGEIRDKKTTEYLGFVPDTIHILKNVCGLHYYNEMILYNETGNLAITSGNYLDISRKVGKQHQNILVFYKGDIKHIKEKFGAFSEK